MKNRIKKFYKDHETEILVAVATAAITGTTVALHCAEANRVVGVKASQRSDGEIGVWVLQKNRKENFFRGMPSQID